MRSADAGLSPAMTPATAPAIPAAPAAAAAALGLAVVAVAAFGLSSRLRRWRFLSGSSSRLGESARHGGESTVGPTYGEPRHADLGGGLALGLAKAR